jgi:hypothetical protein
MRCAALFFGGVDVRASTVDGATQQKSTGRPRTLLLISSGHRGAPPGRPAAARASVPVRVAAPAASGQEGHDNNKSSHEEAIQPKRRRIQPLGMQQRSERESRDSDESNEGVEEGGKGDGAVPAGQGPASGLVGGLTPTTGEVRRRGRHCCASTEEVADARGEKDGG